MHTIQKMNPQVNGDKTLLILKESKGFTEFQRAEKREEGERGDTNEMRWNLKRQEQASQ